MTMAEFNIRLFAFKRLEKKENIKLFELSKNIITAGMIDGKAKKGIIKDLYNNYVGVRKSTVNTSEFQRDVMRKAIEDYNNRNTK